MDRQTSDACRTLWQILAIVCTVVLLSVILHKGYTDVSLLAQQHSGKQFWVALGKYFIGNLAGGGKAAADPPTGEASPHIHDRHRP